MSLSALFFLTSAFCSRGAQPQPRKDAAAFPGRGAAAGTRLGEGTGPKEAQSVVWDGIIGVLFTKIMGFIPIYHGHRFFRKATYGWDGFSLRPSKRGVLRGVSPLRVLHPPIVAMVAREVKFNIRHFG